MAKTTTQLADAVLRKIGVCDASETPATADRTLVTDAYADKYEELAAPGMELVYWSASSIPNAVFTTLVELMVNDVQSAFGQPQAPVDRMQQEAFILTKLRRHVATDSSGLPTQTEYF